MPWEIESDHADCNGFAVVKKSDGSVAGCHDTREEAEAQLRALYAKEPAMAAVGGGSCGCETTSESVRTDPDPFGETLATTLLAAVRSPYMDAAIEGRRARRALLAAAMEPLDAPFPVPAYPPREWFQGPPTWVAPWRAAAGLKPADDGGILRLTITDEGRIGGWFFNAGQCLVHDPSACPKHSPTRYAAFHQSDVLCADGSMLDVGVIGMTHGHQSPWLDWKEAQRLYADPTAQKILCVAGDTEHGGWIAGAVVPGTTYGDVAMMRRSGLSGDWRPMPQSWWAEHGISAREVRDVEGYDCIGPTLVTRPALPLVRNFSTAGRAAAILGGSAGIELDVSRFARRDRERITILAATDPELSRFTRRAYTFDESAVERDEAGRFTFKDGGGGPKATHTFTGLEERTDLSDKPGGVIPDVRPQLDVAGEFDFGRGDTPPMNRWEPVALPNRVSLYSKDVQDLIDANPRISGEDDFAYQGRIVQGLDPQTASDVIYEMRETYEPVDFVNDGLDRWNEENGLRPVPDNIAELPVDLAEADEIARFFETVEDQSDDPVVREAYDDFKDQSARMYDYMTRPESEGGMGITVEFTDETDPYPTARAQAADIEDNKRIVIERGLGGEHSMLTQDEYDRFRAVHDVFGHAAIGGGFDRHGEYQAWLTHASMYTDPGRLAMSTEYHGVNSAAWSGDPGSPGTGKAVLLPGEFGIPPWERSDAEEQQVAAAARAAAAWPTPDDPNAEGVKAVIEMLGIDEEFTRKFDHPAWHYAQPRQGAWKGPIGAKAKPDPRLPKVHVASISRFARRAYTFDESAVTRDEGGRFTFKDGGADPSEGTHSKGAPGEVDTTTADLREEAAILADRAAAAEKIVTPILEGLLVGDTAQLLGFDFRLKSEERMAQKLAEKHAEGLDDEAAINAIADPLRYTIGDVAERYPDTTRSAIDTLQQQGFTLVKEPKNFWERGDAYSGINTQWRTPDGQRFELQFHTPESFDTVQAIHKDYETYRTSTDPQLRAQLWDSMVQAWEGVEVPEEILDVGTLSRSTALQAAAADMSTHYYKTDAGRYFRRRRDDTGQYLEILEPDGSWRDLPSLISYLVGQDDGYEEIDSLPPDVQQASVSRFARRAYTFDESAVQRDEGGRFTFKDGGGEGRAPKEEAEGSAGDDGPSGGGSSLAEKFVQGEKVIVPAEEVATFTDTLAEFLEAEKQSGAGGKLNLCEVSVPGTNLFCGDNIGMTRLEMPQLIGVPTPGSRADRLPKDNGGAVDIQEEFTKRLAEMGVDIAEASVPSASLKASQAELRSDKSVGIAEAIREGKVDIEGGERIFVSKDGYILDGHHRWAGAILNDFEDGHLGDAIMPVARVDMGIRELVDLANEFAAQMGIAPKGTGPEGDPLSGMARGAAMGSRFARRAGWFREEEHPRADDGKFTEGEGGGGGEDPKAAAKAEKEAAKAEKREKKQDDKDRHTVEWNLARHNSFFKTLGGFADRDIILRDDIPRPVLRDLGQKAMTVRYDEEGAAKIRQEILDRGLDDHAEKEGRPMKAAIAARPAATVRASQEGNDMDRFILLMSDGTRVDTAYSDVRIASLAIVASVTAAGDLPVAPPETAWDEATAKANLLEASGGDEAVYGRGFLFHDDTQTGPESYYWPIADVVDGEVMVVPAAVDAALKSIDDGTIGELTDEEKEATLAILHTYVPVPEDVADAAEMLASMQAELTSLRARVDAHDEFRDAEMRARAAAIVKDEKPLPIPAEEPLPVA